MTPRRFQILYTPRAKVVAAGKANGWTEESGESLLDAVGDHFSFEEVDSEYRSLEDALPRAKALVNDERDFFGVVTIEEQEYRLIVPADRYYEWLTTVRHNVDETGILETIREDEAA